MNVWNVKKRVVSGVLGLKPNQDKLKHQLTLWRIQISLRHRELTSNTYLINQKLTKLHLPPLNMVKATLACRKIQI